MWCGACRAGRGSSWTSSLVLTVLTAAGVRLCTTNYTCGTPARGGGEEGSLVISPLPSRLPFGSLLGPCRLPSL
eukprot:7771780-Alexandrium_andersonii.AAC.1